MSMLGTDFAEPIMFDLLRYLSGFTYEEQLRRLTSLFSSLAD